MLTYKRWLIYAVCGLLSVGMLGYTLGRYQQADSMYPPAEPAQLPAVETQYSTGALPNEIIANQATPPQPNTTDDVESLPDRFTAPADDAEESVATETEAAHAETVFAGVEGAVRRPGFYSLEAGQRIHHLIEAAGGVTDSADLGDINLAAWVLDGSTLYVPETPNTRQEAGTWVLRGATDASANNMPQYTRSGWRPYWNPAYQAAHEAALAEAQTAPDMPSDDAASASSPSDARIDINTASAEMLQTLPGIGPVMSGNIIAYREQAPFRSIEEITNVSGIGEKRFEAIRGQITVSP